MDLIDPWTDFTAPLASPSVSLAAPRAEAASSLMVAWVEAKRVGVVVRIARVAMREVVRKAIILGQLDAEGRLGG